MDCFHVATCIVVDKETNKPIDSATVEAFLVNESESVFVEMKYTDKTGLFDVGTGPLPKRGCSKDFMILISKKGYKNIVLNEPMRDTIRLEPNNFLRDRYERVWKKR
jgi:hypothetical protein